MIVDPSEKFIIVPKSYYELNWYDFSGKLIRTMEYPNIKDSNANHYNITKMMFSRDGKYLFCSSGNNILYCIDNYGNFVFKIDQPYFDGTGTGHCPISLLNPQNNSSIAFLSLREQCLKFINIQGKVEEIVQVKNPRNFAVSPIKDIGVVEYWNYDEPQKLRGIKIIDIKKDIILKDLQGVFGDIYFSRNGNFFVVLGEISIYVYTPEGRLINKVSQTVNNIGAIYCLSKENQFITISTNHIIRFDLPDLSVKSVSTRIFDHLNYFVSSTCLSKDRKLFAIGGGDYWTDGIVEFYDDQLNFVKSFKLSGKHHICGITISPDNKYFATISYSNSVDIWELETGRNILSYANGHIGDRSGIIFAPDGQSIYFVLSYKKQGSNLNSFDKIRQIDLSGNVIRTFDNSNDASFIHLTNDQHKLITTGLNGTINFFTLEGQLLESLYQNSNWSGLVSFSNDGKYLTSGYSYTHDNTIKVWDSNGFKLVNTIKNLDNQSVESLVFLNDNRFLLSSSGNKAIIWDRNTGKSVLSIFFFNDRDWTVVTPQGYFDCSEWAKDYLCWVKGFEVYDLGQFFEEFNSPKLLGRMLAGESIGKSDINISTLKLPSDAGITQGIIKYVENEINKWQKKGEFEKTSDYQKRVNDQTRTLKAQELANAALDKFKIENRKLINIMSVKLGEYDADNEAFLIDIINFGQIILPVPIEFAPVFKSNWSSMDFKNIDFYINNDQLNISRIDFFNKVLKRTFTYDSKTQMNYSLNTITYNFSPIEIDLNEDGQNKNNKIETRTIAVGKSDVDTNIPLAQEKRQDYFAVVIGNENYANEIPVNYAKNDANSMGEYFIKVFGIPKENIHVLRDASFGQMLQEVDWLNNISKAFGTKARIFFYYAGHGVPNETTKDAYLLPVDGRSVATNTAIKLEDLYNKLTEYKTRSVTVFLDACFSGAARDGFLADGRGVRIRPTEYALRGNIVVFSAATGDETAFPYGQKYHGLFTYYLLKKMKEDISNITYKGLIDYLSTNVGQQSVIMNQKSQTPQIRVSSELADEWQNFKLK